MQSNFKDVPFSFFSYFYKVSCIENMPFAAFAGTVKNEMKMRNVKKMSNLKIDDQRKFLQPKNMKILAINFKCILFH